jgi:thiol-disulfide isomerase/thioredoxin
MRTLEMVLIFLLFALSIASSWRDSAGRAEAQGRYDGFVTRLTSEDWPQPAPQLIGQPEDWLNTDGKPLKLRRGTVYLIDFWEYTCVNCIRTLPYLKEWNRRYAKDGLVIIGIHTPEFAFARDRANVAQAVKKFGITWPVLIDSEYKNWQAYGNNFWPRKYFIDLNGRIIADHGGEGSYAESEARIQQMLRQLHPDIRFEKPMAPVRDTDKPGAICYPTTPELYAGERGSLTGQHGNIQPFAPGTISTYTDPGTHQDGLIYLNGDWRTEKESLRHASATAGLNDYVALRYHALECNAVIKPEGGEPLRVVITQDGKPVARTDAGADIRYDEQNRSYILVDEPRMYRLTKNAKFGTYELRLASTSPDFGLYSFTFTSCEIR